MEGNGPDYGPIYVEQAQKRCCCICSEEAQGGKFSGGKKEGVGRDEDTEQEESADPGLVKIFLGPSVQWTGETTSARKLVPISAVEWS